MANQRKPNILILWGDEFPPRQVPASFNLDVVLRSLQDAGGAGSH